MERIAIFGGSFNPPGKHHYLIVQKLLAQYNRVLITPCGSERQKTALQAVTIQQRKEMVLLNFGSLQNLLFDFSDLNKHQYTPTIELSERYQHTYPGTQIWFAVGGDLIAGGGAGHSEIQQTWAQGQRVWNELNFAVITHPALPVKSEDLPPHSQLVTMPSFFGRATLVRQRLAHHLSIDDLVVPEVSDYILKHRLYQPETRSSYES